MPAQFQKPGISIVPQGTPEVRVKYLRGGLAFAGKIFVCFVCQKLIYRTNHDEQLRWRHRESSVMTGYDRVAHRS